MKSKKFLLVLVLIFVIILGGAYTMYSKLSAELGAEQLAVQETYEQEFTQESSESHNADDESSLAPDFTVYDEEGNEVHLYDYKGKPIVLNFWASWCGPCRMEMPDFNEKYLELGDEVQFLMINLTDGSRETVDTATSFIAENGFSFPVFYDSEQIAAMTYGAYSIPTTYFIDADGNAVARATGAIDAATLQQGIDMIK